MFIGLWEHFAKSTTCLLELVPHMINLSVTSEEFWTLRWGWLDSRLICWLSIECFNKLYDFIDFTFVYLFLWLLFALQIRHKILETARMCRSSFWQGLKFSHSCLVLCGSHSQLTWNVIMAKDKFIEIRFWNFLFFFLIFAVFFILAVFLIFAVFLVFLWWFFNVENIKDSFLEVSFVFSLEHLEEWLKLLRNFFNVETHWLSWKIH